MAEDGKASRGPSFIMAKANSYLKESFLEIGLHSPRTHALEGKVDNQDGVLQSICPRRKIVNITDC